MRKRHLVVWITVAVLLVLAIVFSSRLEDLFLRLHGVHPKH